jgi:hypothetical protein
VVGIGVQVGVGGCVAVGLGGCVAVGLGGGVCVGEGRGVAVGTGVEVGAGVAVGGGSVGGPGEPSDVETLVGGADDVAVGVFVSEVAARATRVGVGDGSDLGVSVRFGAT